MLSPSPAKNPLGVAALHTAVDAYQNQRSRLAALFASFQRPDEKLFNDRSLETGNDLPTREGGLYYSPTSFSS